jgi:hypothetical protein
MAKEKKSSYLRIVHLGSFAQQQFLKKKLPAQQLEIPFRNDFNQFCYSTNIFDKSLSNVRGFEQLGYKNEKFKSILDVEELVHSSTKLRYAYQAMAAFQYVFAHQHELTTFDLDNLVYRNYVLIEDRKGFCHRVLLTCKLRFEETEAGFRIIGNETVGQILEQIDLDEFGRPLDLIVQRPSVTSNGKPCEDMITYILEKTNPFHLQHLKLSAHELKVMTLLAKNYNATKIVEKFEGYIADPTLRTKKIQRIRADQKKILSKCRIDFAFETAAQAARHYRKYGMI